MAALVVGSLEAEGTKVLRRTMPVSVERRADGRLSVQFDSKRQDIFDTVLWAIGREPQLKALNLAATGIATDAKSLLIIGDDQDRTNLPHIYAIGDILHNRPQLTPVAIQAGKLLARRLFAHSNVNMDYDKVPTTVFTPLEYGCVGLSEEAAVDRFGADSLEIYHAFYKPLELAVAGRDTTRCYIKAICQRTSPRIIHGLHFTGPNAGEVTQGFATAMRCQLTIEALQATVGIHPTTAEEFVKLNITKRSGKDPTVTAC